MGAGVVFALDGRLWGGDAALYYVGTYGVDGDAMSAKVTTNRHTNNALIQSVFGIDRVNIELNGKTNGDEIKATGRAAEAPGVTFDATLSRISD
jgi:hypothetical protein